MLLVRNSRSPHQYLPEFEKIEIKNIFLSQSFYLVEESEKLKQLKILADQNKSRILCFGKGDYVMDGKLKITCLYPTENKEIQDGNEGSLVLDVSYGDFNMLLTGDISVREEQELLLHKRNSKGGKEEEVSHVLKQYEVLKVAHHGSASSTCEEFLEIVRPKVSLISCGINNIYGHPAKEVEERIGKSGSLILDTRVRGAITIRPEVNGDFLIEIFHK